MGSVMIFVAVTKEQYDEIQINEDDDFFDENILSELECGEQIELEREFSAINFLLANCEFLDDGINAPDYTDAYFLEEKNVFCLDVDEVQELAETFKGFTKSDFKHRFLSDKFKAALASEEIYRGGEFGDEEYFENLWSLVEYLSTFFIRKAEEHKAILIQYG